jgi:predicted ferric reductase
MIMIADIVQLSADRFNSAWPWYVVRGSGFVAAALLFLLMLSGIGQATGLSFRFIEPIKAWAIHKILAFAFLGAIAVHGAFLLIDKFLPFSLVQVLVPFASNYNNKSTFLSLPLGMFGVTMGILAFYGSVIIVATSLGWIDSKKVLWRYTHYLSYVVLGLVFLHSLYVGSDIRYGTFRNIWILIGVFMVAAVVVRLYRAGTLISKS